MFKNYFKIAFRNLIRNKAFTFINIFGLAVGLATCLLILLYIFDETSYDKHHKDAERIFRIASTGKGEPWAAVSAPLAWGLKADMPEVEQVTRLLKFPNLDKILLRYEYNNASKQFYESNGYYVDSTFFQLFTYHFRYGDPQTALQQPNSLVISEDIADKLFHDENPVGKTVRIGLPFGEFNYTVQGVFDNPENKSHIPARFFLSMRNSDAGGWVAAQTNWATNSIFHTYVKLKKTADPRSFERKLQPFLERRGGDDMRAGGVSKQLFIQPVKDIYLHSDLGNEIAATGNIRYLYILSSIAIFILIIACINFMNLSTARSEKRAKEVGVRKVMGAEKSSLIQQFLGESFLMCLMALVLALIMAWLLLPFFNKLAEKQLQAFHDPRLIIWIIVLTLITGLISGLYPAFYLSAFKPIAVLKGKIINNFSAVAIRKGLVVFQFMISICLMVGAIVIWQQLKFLKNQHLGFNKNQQIVLPLQSSSVSQNYTALKNELLNNPHVKTVTSCSSYPGIQNATDMLFFEPGKTVHDAVDIHLSTVEQDFFQTLGLELIQGRAFSREFTADSASLVLNEAAVKALGYDAKSAIGKTLYFEWQNGRHSMQIVGVVKDFHYESLHSSIRPFGFATGFFADPHNYVIANLKTTDYTSLLADFEHSWNKINPSTPFVYSFLDQDFQKNYEKDERTSGIVGYFTIIAILIGCLGLFGLSAFSAEQRTREIGIRKVLGASVINVAALLSRDFVRLVLLALLIATPLAWFGMHKWLQGFAYRIGISWWIFLLAGCIAIMIALVTVSFQAIKAALANPLKNLRRE
jgi:putative ABC transport system permease protein